MINCKLGKIYKIVRLTDNEIIYVGSTTKKYLCSRLAEHKNMSKYRPNMRVYKAIADNGGWENHQIVLIELCACDTKDELYKKRKRFYSIVETDWKCKYASMGKERIF